MLDRWIHLDGLVNMRDVGGLPTRDGRHTATRRLIRSDNLQDLTDADVATLVHDLGVTDVVDLRSETELHLEGPGPLSRVAGLTHHHHSLLAEHPAESAEEVAARALAIKERPARDGSFWAKHYRGYLTERPDSVSAALRAVAESRGAAVVHCAAGKDRTGTVVALALDVAGVSHEEIVADYALTGERIEAIIERLRPRAAYGPALARQQVADQVPRPESVRAVLDAVTQGFDGASGWLRAHGWTGDDVGRLRRRLTEE